MSHGRNIKPREQLVPFRVIEAAVAGDEEAVLKILRHYERYITKLSLISVTDNYGCTGCPISVVNQDLKDCLQAKLLWCVTMKFKMY